MTSKASRYAFDLLHLAQSRLEQDHKKVQKRINETAGTPIADFIEKFLEWRLNERKKSWLWCMFDHAIHLENELTVLDNLDAFVVNCLLDDSAFVIEWRKIDYGPDFAIQWLPGGSFKTKLTSKEDPEGRPVVVWNNDGTQNTNLLLEAMKIVEEREEKRLADISAEFGDDEI